jgi:hypothetical protein
MKKRRYADLYGYTQEEFDRWLESGINNKLLSIEKPGWSWTCAVLEACKNETRRLPRRALREMGTTSYLNHQQRNAMALAPD